ncbi:oxidoreductase [Mangrovactinospora gilvigrisea]|uniref:Oxidoreductase n=1 Tax=Mangrovactinospora gilvigrisea TaxID=1428644 RepID=A0A1J7BSZ3_9ACTN|nr:FAD-dependent monooxygenase [Mangrovactinospora gilvigrisea]OIV36585.1 oxidoreductase [Mangrovactinospora gilvigrisea]
MAVVGGGPGGLYLAALLRRPGPTPRPAVTVQERNPPERTFGFGVVFSDETLDGIAAADPAVHTELSRRFVRWDAIDIHHRGRVLTSHGHGFAALGRHQLLGLLQRRAADLGAELRFRSEVRPDGLGALAAGHDLLVAADGVGSAVRAEHAAALRPEVARGRCVYLWLGAELALDAFEFHILRTPHGIVQVHAYPYRRAPRPAATLVVEMREDVHRRILAGLDADKSRAVLGELLAPVLRGARVEGDTDRWAAFGTVRCAAWSDGGTVLLGDAAHTAHFSIGSGTKLALEDAAALADRLRAPGQDWSPGSLAEALRDYEAERRPVVESTQRAARASQEWFEDLPLYVHQPPLRFAFNLLCRSRRITHANLRLRDPRFTARVEAAHARGCADGIGADVPPMFRPFRLAGLELKNRVLVSAMDMYSAADGLPGDFHLAHLGARALGGAGLVMTEMVCVSPSGRITPGCAGLWNDAQEAAWARIADLVHSASTARLGLQLGHSGRKGSTRLMWEGMDEPLPNPAENWRLVAPSALPYRPGSSRLPHAATRAELAAIRREFAAAAARAARAGVDLLELHCAHGYLLSSFLSPLTNRRSDVYGERLRYPLEVLAAVREAWDGPLSVRISATDWHPGGNGSDEGVELAAAFAAAGADAISVSTGQVVSDEAPAFGRSYQAPFADRIRNTAARERGTAVITAGNISSWDDVNSLLLAGRADLVALGRPHLWDPHWTLHAAAEQGYAGPGAEWPAPYRAGSRPPRTGRTGKAN